MQNYLIRSTPKRPSLVLCLFFSAVLSVACKTQAEQPETGGSAAAGFGTFERPFSAQSYWNSRPTGVELGDFQIPDSTYRPLVGEGPYSTSAFLADENDSPQKVFGIAGKPGLWELDGEQFIPNVTIPRWPSETIPARGSDGHADIVDPIDGVIHSFLNLKKDKEGRWTASMYAWTRLDGRGWGDPSHYYQGARAAAVPPMAGLVRKHEVNDGQPLYHHALAMSLTFNGLSSETGYVFPATSADRTWKENTGGIPEGALLMLPEAFDTNLISDPGLRKIAETLKVYGAYVVDRNHGTPFYIYVENGSKFEYQKPKWDASVTKDLKRIQKALRQVTSVQGWVDGHGKEFDAVENLNLISMRGPWVKTKGSGEARYDTWTQSMVITDDASEGSEFQHRNNRSFSAVDWARMKAGKSYALQFKASEGIQMELKIFGTKGKRMLFNSHWLNNGDSVKFTWPGEHTRTVVTVRKTTSDGKESRARALVYPEEEFVANPLSKVASMQN